MADASDKVFEDLSSWRRLKEMIGDGDAEGLHLECKAPGQPRVTKDLQAHLGRAVSGFANTAGGVVLYGMSTTRHTASKLDVLTDIEPIGNVASFEQQLQRYVVTVATPPALGSRTKILKARKRDTRGLVVLHVPKTLGDPVQSTEDNRFYFRSGDAFTVAPYAMIKRLFSATDSPDLRPLFGSHSVSPRDDGSFNIVVRVQNMSSAIAEHVKVFAVVENADACAAITPGDAFEFQPPAKPGMEFLMCTYPCVIHRGLREVIGDFEITMKARKRRLDLAILVYANRMVARRFNYAVTLSRASLSVQTLCARDLY